MYSTKSEAVNTTGFIIQTLHYKKTGNVRINVTLRRVRVSTLAV